MSLTKLTSSQVTYKQGGTGSETRSLGDKLRESVSPEDFGAVGDWDSNTQTGTDDTDAIQLFFNYCRDNQVKGIFPNNGKSYRITSGLVTQHDGNTAPLEIDFNDVPIIVDFSGSVAITVTGGASLQILHNLYILPSTAHQMNSSTYANKDVLSHGVAVTNTIAYISGKIKYFRGHGYYHSNTALNSNTCEWDLEVSSCNIGFYCKGDIGLSDDFSVCQLNLKVGGCAGPGLFGEDDCIIRQWDGWIYSENNCQHADYAANAAIEINRGTANNLWIYAEQVNANNEVKFNTNTSNNIITSVRKNKDLDGGTGNSWRIGNIFHSPDSTNRTATPIVAHNEYARVAQDAEWVQIDVKGNTTFGVLRGIGNSTGDPYIGLYNADRTKYLRLNTTNIQANVPHDWVGVLAASAKTLTARQSNSLCFRTTTINSAVTIATLSNSSASFSAMCQVNCLTSGGQTFSFVYLLHRNVSTGLVATLLTADPASGHVSPTFSLSSADIKVSMVYDAFYGAAMDTFIALSISSYI